MKHFLIAIGCFFVVNQMLLAEDPLKSYQTNTLPDGTVVYFFPDTIASFPGGVEEMNNFINQNLKHPAQDKKSYIDLHLIIKENGEIVDYEIIISSDYINMAQAVDKWLGKEIERIVRLMPNFIPAKVEDENVASYYLMPISWGEYQPVSFNHKKNQ